MKLRNIIIEETIEKLRELDGDAPTFYELNCELWKILELIDKYNSLILDCAHESESVINHSFSLSLYISRYVEVDEEKEEFTITIDKTIIKINYCNKC